MAIADTAPSSSPRAAGLILPATMIVLAIVLAVANLRWPLEDFVEYWSAGRLNAAGANPYDPAAVLREQVDIGWTDPEPIMMYNPPWTLALAMPIGAVEFRLARSIWLPLELFLTLWCASRLWLLYGGAPERVTRAWFVALLWTPTMLALRFGQLSPFMLFGLVGFLWCVRRERDFAAGALLSLTAVKPQLVALVWVPFALWALADRRWKALAGAATCIVIGSLAALSTNPRVFAQYFALMSSAPPTLTFESPNIATVLRVFSHTKGSWPQYIPTALGTVGVVWMWYRQRTTWDWRRHLPGLVILSCLLTSYGGWAFDLVVLLVPIVALAALLSRTDRRSVVLTGVALLLAVSALSFVMHARRVPQAAFLWITPVVALAWWTMRPSTD
jgi:hypothetical protein